MRKQTFLYVRVNCIQIAHNKNISLLLKITQVLIFTKINHKLENNLGLDTKPIYKFQKWIYLVIFLF